MNWCLVCNFNCKDIAWDVTREYQDLEALSARVAGVSAVNIFNVIVWSSKTRNHAGIRITTIISSVYSNRQGNLQAVKFQWIGIRIARKERFLIDVPLQKFDSHFIDGQIHGFLPFVH
jgi:hypothetical protein